MTKVQTKKLVQIAKKNNIKLTKKEIIIPIMYKGTKIDPTVFTIDTFRGEKFGLNKIYIHHGLKINFDESKNFIIKIFTLEEMLGDLSPSHIMTFVFNRKGKMLKAMDEREESRAVYFRTGYKEYIDERPMDLEESTDILNELIQSRLDYEKA